ncbi:hypothetical protein AAHE18_03G184300 [Arachis hypogaea]
MKKKESEAKRERWSRAAIMGKEWAALLSLVTSLSRCRRTMKGGGVSRVSILELHHHGTSLVAPLSASCLLVLSVELCGRIYCRRSGREAFFRWQMELGRGCSTITKLVRRGR